LQGAFEKFVDSPYYSESEVCGGAVTVSFLKYLPWQVMYFLQHSSHISKTCSRLFAASSRRFWPWSSLFRGWKSPEIAWARFGLYDGCSNGVPLISASTSIATFKLCNANAPLRLLDHPKKGSLKMTITPFLRSEWSIVRSALLAKGGTSKKRLLPHLHKVLTQSNKKSPHLFKCPS